MRLRECEYVHCSGCGAVRAQSSLPVSNVYGFGVWGAARSHDQKVKRLPTLRGGPAQRPHQIHLPTSWAPVQRESRTVRPISLAFLGVQRTVGRRSTRATPVDRPAVSPQPPPGRLHALLNASAASESTAAGSLKAASSNASAASESTTAGGLEAFSQSSAARTERFENASSKFRWNPSPAPPLDVSWEKTQGTNVQRRHPGWLG